MRQRHAAEKQILAQRFRESFRRVGYPVVNAARSAQACLRVLGEKTPQPIAGARSLEKQEAKE